METIALSSDDRDLVRSLILAEPSLVLEDDQVMQRLVGETRGDRQVVDLRDRLVERLEMRLSKMASQQRAIVAAAYENVAGTKQLHDAVLSLIEPPELDAFLQRLTQDVPERLGLEEARLCLEADVTETGPRARVRRWSGWTDRGAARGHRARLHVHGWFQRGGRAARRR